MPTFKLRMNPPTATSQEIKTAYVNGRVMRYKSKAAKETFRVLNEALKPYAPEAPMTGPIFLACHWMFPQGKSHKNGEWKISAPDTDNLQKALKDVMTRLGFWEDDRLVCSEVITKSWSNDPGIKITYDSLTEAGVTRFDIG